MRRRTLLRATAFGTGTGLAIAKPAVGQSEAVLSNRPNIRWRMATSWPKSSDIVFGNINLLCQRVSEMTSGRFVITPYESGELVPGLAVMDAVAEGTVECGHTAAYYYIDKNPALAFSTTVPFGLNAQQHLTWLLDGGGLEVLADLYADLGIVHFPAGSTGAQMGGWFRRKIEVLSDLQGLKMRIPGLAGNILERLGVEIKVLPGNEIFASLEQGTIDAAEWIGPYEDERLGLNRVAPYYYYPGWWEPGTTYEIQINRGEWDQLPAEYQEALKTATLEAHVQMLAAYDSANGSALERLLISGTELFVYSDEILNAAREETFAWYEETAKTDGQFRDVYESWKIFREQVYDWDAIARIPDFDSMT